MSALIEAADAYYAGSPIMSDAEFDALAAASGYDRVGTKGGKVQHSTPMLSLDKPSDPLDWWERIGKPDLIRDIKVDGMAIAIRYVNGQFTQAISRGDGKSGNDISDAVYDSGAAPERLADAVTIEVRGELYCPRGAFERLDYATPQAAVAALVRRGTTAGAGLRFAAHDPTDGFQDCEYGVADMDSLDADIRAWPQWIYNIPTDGMVLKVRDLAYRAELGSTSRTPLWAIAVKP